MFFTRMCPLHRRVCWCQQVSFVKKVYLTGAHFLAITQQQQQQKGAVTA